MGVGAAPGSSGSETGCHPHRLHRGQAPTDGGAWLRALSPPRTGACRLVVSSSVVCTCSSASSRSRSVSARACLALGADRREPRIQALALRLHLGNLVLELLHLPLRHQLLVLSRLRTRASCSWLSAALQLASRFLEAIRGYARARPVRGGARRPPQPGAATSTVGSAAPRCLRRASGVGAGRVEAGLDSQAVGR